MFKSTPFSRCARFAMAPADLNGLSLAIPVLNSFCQGIKAFRSVDSAGNALGEETALAVFGSHRQDVQVLQATSAFVSTANR